jgi:tetratricopeptide (TPR) repeat protein
VQVIRRLVLPALVVLLFFLLLTNQRFSGSALAAPADPNAKAALAAFNDGQVAFNLGQWDKAIEAWERGFKLKPDAVFLYNIAQAHRKAGRSEQAIFFYKNYLRQSSTAPNRDEVVGWVEQLEKQLADERQQKADEEKRKAEEAAAARKAAEEEAARRRQQDDAARLAAAPANRPLRGDLGLRVGVNLWAAGLSSSRSPSAAVELTGGYTVFQRGRLGVRVGAAIGFTYLIDLNDRPVNLLAFLAEPSLHVDLWKKKLFFVVDVGVGALVITGMPTNVQSALLAPGKGARGTFAAFEARPAVAIEYQPIRRLGITLSPGLAISSPPTKDFSPLVRVQILAGVSVKL